MKINSLAKGTLKNSFDELHEDLPIFFKKIKVNEYQNDINGQGVSLFDEFSVYNSKLSSCRHSPKPISKLHTK
ncbi:hypothetical protein IMCC3317_12470 [Kordia antarctica]|uniref:Uncharacterized protein n=1 Tax=Kordia antarctica TaxID=1218801 RepID=A0A7L4ZHI9_9FLAO|nr:hypothetical protein IMCC3317_12470 [Kordia antarctica]